MQFSNFSRLEEGLTITLSNKIPIENVGEIKYYTDNLSGSFIKKEFRWSFNNEHWASWEILTQSAISRINTFNNYYFFLQIRYTLTAPGSGNVTTFNVNYKEGTAIPITPRILTSDIQANDASAVLIHDILQKHEVTKITDASTLNGETSNYYLNRKNHIGPFPFHNSLRTIDGSGTYHINKDIHDTLVNGFTGTLNINNYVLYIVNGVISVVDTF